MNKLLPFSKLTKSNKFPYLSDVSVVVDKKETPLGFVFGREAFISFLEKLDEEFEIKVKDPKQAHDNPAGKLIDLIEQHLPLNPKFVKDLKSSLSSTKSSDWIPFDEVVQNMHV